MSPRMVAIVKRPNQATREQRAVQARFWRQFSATEHVHDFAKVDRYRAFVCIVCGVMLRRVGG